MNASKSIQNEIYELETRLLLPDVRAAAKILSPLIADDFLEIGASGRLYNKQETIEALASSIHPARQIENFATTMLSPDTVLTTYSAQYSDYNGAVHSSLRSSIWKRFDTGWQIIFHQGTSLET